MTDRAELDSALRTFLTDGTDELADRVIEAALDQIDRTSRRPTLRMRQRFQAMPMLTRLAAAAVIGVLAVGGALLVTRPNIPGVGDASQSPAQPSPTPRPTHPATTPPPPPPSAQTGPMGDGRQIHAATRLDDGRVLIAGGYDNEDGALASAVVYDPGADTFSATAPLADARGAHTATLLPDGRVLITGGGPPGWPGSFTGIPSPFLASAELYDPRTGRFSPTGSMATPREVHTATLLADGRVLIIGGADFQAHALASAELYDPTTGTFSPTSSMTTARAFHTATLLADGRVLVAGGSPAAWGSTAHLASAEVYDPATGTFTPTGPMTGGREFQTATVLADGRVLIAGGSSGSEQDVPGDTADDIASAEVYDPATGAFTPTGPLIDGRQYQTATLLGDGRVLVVGGGADYVDKDFLASAELYDPTTGTFVATGPMGVTRTNAAASRLADGRVLITGGWGAVAPLASAEIYDPSTGTFSPAGLGG